MLFKQTNMVELNRNAFCLDIGLLGVPASRALSITGKHVEILAASGPVIPRQEDSVSTELTAFSSAGLVEQNASRIVVRCVSG